jgi:hypothetical protein
MAGVDQDKPLFSPAKSQRRTCRIVVQHDEAPTPTMHRR